MGKFWSPCASAQTRNSHYQQLGALSVYSFSGHCPTPFPENSSPSLSCKHPTLQSRHKRNQSPTSNASNYRCGLTLQQQNLLRYVPWMIPIYTAPFHFRQLCAMCCGRESLFLPNCPSKRPIFQTSHFMLPQWTSTFNIDLTHLILIKGPQGAGCKFSRGPR